MDQNQQSQESSEGEERVIIENNEESDNDEMGLYLKKGEYNVEKIIDIKVSDGQKYYFVKWDGYPESDNTWEPEANLANIAYMVEEFEKQQAEKQSSKPADDKEETEKKSPKPEAPVEKKAIRGKRPKLGFSSEDEENIVKKVKADDKEKESVKEVGSNKVVSKTNSDKSKEDKVKSSENIKTNASGKTEKKEAGNKKAAKASKKEAKSQEANNKETKEKNLAPPQPYPIARRRDKAGSIRMRDKPKSILGIKPGKNNDEFFFMVEWEKRGDGVKPENSAVTNEDLRQYNPNFLLDFYESKIVIFSKKLAEERREKSMTAQDDLKLNWLDSNSNKENRGEGQVDEIIKSLPSKNKKQKERGMLREINSHNQLTKELTKKEKSLEEIARGMDLENLDEFGNNVL